MPPSLATQQESMQTGNKYLDVGMISILTANTDKVLLWLVLFSTLPFPSMIILKICLLCELTMKPSTFTDKTWNHIKWAAESTTVQC